MRKILSILLFLTIAFFAKSQTTYPITQGLGSQTTLVKVPVNGGLQAVLVATPFVDTTAANAVPYVKYTPGAMIRTTSDGLFWKRNEVKTRWVGVGGAGAGDIISFSFYNDSLVIICYASGSCDTIPFNNNNTFVTVNNAFGGCNNLLSGGIVTAANPTVNLVMDVTAADYTIGCRAFHTDLSQVTLANGDATFGRFDRIIVDTNNTVSVLQGTPSANPQEPQVNPASQLSLVTFLVPAGATTATQLGITQTVIYDQNLGTPTEWNGAATAWTSDRDNLFFPFHLTKSDLVSGTTGSTSQISWTTTDTMRNGQFDVFKFYIRLTDAWVTGQGLDISFYRGATKVTNSVIFSNNSYGFDQATTGSYFVAAIPMANWVFTDSIFFSVVIKPLASPFISSQAFRLDWIQLQGGINQALGGSSGLYIWNQYSLDQPANYRILGAASIKGGITSTTDAYYLSERYGLNAIANGVAATAVGAYSTVTGNNGTAIGDESSSTGGIALGYFSRSGGSTNISIGGTTASATSSILLGKDGAITGNQSIGFGQNVTVAHNNSIVFGYFGASTAANQFVVGSSQGTNVVNSFYLGSVGVSGTEATDVSWRISGESGTNQAGHALTIGSGLGTGNSASGSVINFQTAVAGSSGTTLQSYATQATLLQTGQWNWSKYLLTTSFSGTAVGALGFDATGNIITMAAGGGSNTDSLFGVQDNSSTGARAFDGNGNSFQLTDQGAYDIYPRLSTGAGEFGVYDQATNGQRLTVLQASTNLFAPDDLNALELGNTQFRVYHQALIQLFSEDGAENSFIEIDNTAATNGIRLGTTKAINITSTDELTLDASGGIFAGTIPYNSGAGIVALGIDTVALSPTFGQIVRKTASAGTTYTFSEGLNETGGAVVWGGTVSTDRTLTLGANTVLFTANTLAGDPAISITSTSTAATGGTQKLLNASLSGANANNNEISYAAYFSNTHTGTNAQNRAVYGETSGASSITAYFTSTNGTALFAQSSGGTYGLEAQATTGIGAYIHSDNGGVALSTQSTGVTSVQMNATYSSTNSVVTVAELVRATSGTAANGIGGSLDFYNEADNGTNYLSNQVVSKLTTAANATRVAEYSIWGVNSATNFQLMSLAGNGLMTLGVAGTNKGSIALTGNTSGTVTIQPAAAAGTWSLTLPTNDGDADQVLTTNGSGVTSWTTVAGGSSTWNGITNPTGTQSLTFDDGELNAWTVSSNTETFQTTTANSLTTGTLELWNSSSLTSGIIHDIAVTGTAQLTNSRGLRILRSGANASNAQTIIGAEFGVTNTNATSGTNIAATFTASGATTANIAALFTGSVGMGDANPQTTLQVGGDAGAAFSFAGVAQIGFTNAGSATYITGLGPASTEVFFGAESSNGIVGTYSNHKFTIRTNNTARIEISNGGVITALNLAGTGDRAVLADASGVLSAPVSDRTVKTSIMPLDYGLNELMRLKPVSFEFIDGWKNHGEGRQIGFIAQEVQQVLPGSVFLTPSTGKLGINKEDIIPLLVRSVQQQQEQIELLKKEISQLKNK